MGLFDWLTGKRSKESSRSSPRPEVTEPFGLNSPFIGYAVNGMLVMSDRDTFDYQFGESTLPNPAQRDLDEILPKVTRVRAPSGGIFRGETLERMSYWIRQRLTRSPPFVDASRSVRILGPSVTY